MKNILFYMISLSYCALLAQPLWGAVYLEYEDERPHIRMITVDFTKDPDIEENSRRHNSLLDNRAIIFAERERVPTPNGGMTTFVTQDKDFFSSDKALTFLEWIEKSEKIQSLRFLEINEEKEVLFVEQTLKEIVGGDFYFIPPSKPQLTSKGVEMRDRGSKNEEISSGPLEKFQGLSISCTGSKKAEAHEKIKAILNSHYKPIEESITVE